MFMAKHVQVDYCLRTKSMFCVFDSPMQFVLEIYDKYLCFKVARFFHTMIRSSLTSYES